MRMLCNPTFLFDKRTHHSPKLEEFREIIRGPTVEENRKVVVFSEYERMTILAGEELRKMGVGFVSLREGLPSRKRGALIETSPDEKRDGHATFYLDAGRNHHQKLHEPANGEI
jgi:SNF2 family DNA or RNA helicase